MTPPTEVACPNCDEPARPGCQCPQCGYRLPSHELPKENKHGSQDTDAADSDLRGGVRDPEAT